MNTKDFRSLSAQAQEDLRRKAVIAVMKGRTRQEVAELFGVTRQSVGVWMQRFAENGVKALKAQRRGRRPGSRLQPWQAAQIVKAIEDQHPEQLKMPFYLWTRKAVLLLIKKRFGIKISVWTAGRYLARWGFTPPKAHSSGVRTGSGESTPMAPAGVSRHTPSSQTGKGLDLLGR